jgi:excisionase family DNA binding protein
MAKKPLPETKSQYPTEGLARVTEAAKFLAVSEDTVYREAKAGQIPCTWIRGNIRIPWAALHAMVPQSGKAGV